MTLEPKKLSNWMIVTVLVLVSSAWLGAIIGNTFVASALLSASVVLGPLALLVTLPLALAQITLGYLGTFVVPLWALVGGYLFSCFTASGMKNAVNPMGVELLSESRPITLRVNELASELELPKIKWVGWFKDESINAFAMGISQQEALVAFSKGAIEKLNTDELDAVMAHELAHVVNHDMARMTYAYNLQNALTWFLVFRGFKQTARWLFTPISELEIMRFSRQREYWADAIGATLTSPVAMASALVKIAKDSDKPRPKNKRIAHFMFQAQPNVFLATHTSIEDRVKALAEERYIQKLPIMVECQMAERDNQPEYTI